MKYFLGLSLVFASVVCFATGLTPVPDGDPLLLVLSLITNWKALGPLAIGSMIVVVLVQVLKKLVGDTLWTKAAVTVLGVVYSALFSMQSGASFFDSAVMALLVSGGAVAIYEAVKPLIWKPVV